MDFALADEQDEFIDEQGDQDQKIDPERHEREFHRAGHFDARLRVTLVDFADFSGKPLQLRRHEPLRIIGTGWERAC